MKKVLNQTSSGGSCINDVVSHVANPYLPFGGVGNSGIGHYHGLGKFLYFQPYPLGVTIQNGIPASSLHLSPGNCLL